MTPLKSIVARIGYPTVLGSRGLETARLGISMRSWNNGRIEDVAVATRLGGT